MGSVSQSEWEHDIARAQPPQGELRAIEEAYLGQGHMVVYGYLNGNIPGESWVAWCVNCSAASFGEFDVDALVAGSMPLLTYDDVKWWCRSHRTTHGLAWQDWVTTFDLERER